MLAVFAISWVAKSIVLPISVASYYSTKYMDLVIQCDQAMNTSWYLNQVDKSKLSKPETIQMLSCHDYDKIRKILLISGLPEEYLSYLGLLALETHQRPASEMVELHRFRER